MQEKIQNQIVSAMRARDNIRLITLRGVSAAFTNELVSKGKKPNEILDDESALAVIRRLVKQRRDSIEQFEKGGRKELADNERAEMKILEEFLPAQMSEEKVREIIMNLKATQNDKGKLIGAVMKETAGQADGSMVKRIVEDLLK